MAKTKSGGSTKLGRDSRAKYLGVKIYNGQLVKTGNVILRQRGTKWHPGRNVGRGADDTLYALKEGRVKFTFKKKKTFFGKPRSLSVVEVLKEN